MNHPLLLFIEPIDFHNTPQFNTEYNSIHLITLRQKKTQDNTRQGQHNRTQHHSTSTME